MSHHILLVAEIKCVACVQPLHEAREVSVCCSDQNMIMILHQYVCVEDYLIRCKIVLELAEETFSIAVVNEYSPPAVTP